MRNINVILQCLRPSLERCCNSDPVSTGFSAAKQKFLEAAVTVDSAGMWSKMIFIRLQ